MSTFKFATWNVRGFRDSYKQREILAFAQAQNIDVLFVQETNFRTPLDVARFRRDFHVDAFFSLTNARACGVGAIFISGRFRQRAHCTFGADGRMLFLDVYISGKRTRFVNIYAPVTRSNTNGFFKDLHQILLEPLPHVLLGDFNCVVDSQRDVRGPGRGRSTYYAKELVKVLKHLKLTDTWLYVHEDLFVPTRTSRTTASRIDRTYVPDFLLPSVVDCEVLTPSSSLAGKSDHSPLVTTLRGTPGPHNGNHGWRLDPSLLEDEHSVEQIRDRLRASLRDAPPMTPQVWDALKETWKAILQEEGRARKTRISAQTNELLRRMRIIRGADTLTACTRNYLDSLEASYARLLRLKTRRPLGAHDQSISPSTLDLDEARGNGGVQIAEVKRPDGSMITDSEEISSAFRNYFRAQFQVSDPEEAVFATQQMRDLCQYLQRPSEEEFSALDGEATMDELRGATQKMPPNSAPGVDGLTAGFYATFMDVLGDALLAVVNALLAKHMKPDSFGAGRIVLLLKDGAPPNELSSWRPITLLNVDYKIVAAILNNRIKLLLPGMISPIQSCDGVAEATWQKALERAHLASARIKHLDLTLREKALAAKTCICAFVYYASRIAVIPSRTVTQLNKLIGSLLWDDKPAPVKRHLLQLPENEGGLGLPHIMTMSKILALKTARCLHQATDFFGKGLLRYWCSTNTKFLDAERHLGPLAESPSPFYKTAANTKRMLDTEATECDVDKDPPIRIVEAITRHQLSPDEKRKTKRWRQKQVKQGHDLPKEVRDFMWKRNWEVLPTRDQLHRFGVVPSARCPNCRADESAHHAMFECLAAKPVWRLVAKDFKIRPPPSLDRNRGAFAKLVIACTLFVIWKRRCVAEGKKTPVRAAYPAVSRIRLMVWKHLSEQLEASGEEKFLRRWHTRFFFLKDGNLSMPITPY
ncbi:hypothetical protein HPB52_014471 [Rhipicephalus sanguineus]|uniref:Tick transposon n=1 Tax=Rhipicephalus sanguineus TaxID=34632 RepID=A0A9D4QER6_RHISA|nr:hypothetical protein HPB52_014471 [Rhipicephalus sanguineus]